MSKPILRLYNSLTRQVVPFEPLDPECVRMYNCGPTVYDYGHIGNFRSFLFADVLRRTMEFLGYRVHQVMNLTDVGHMTEDDRADGGGEDKMKVGAQRLKEAKKSGRADVSDPDDPWQVAQFFIDAFLEDARKVGLKVASEYPQNMPRATAHITEMQQMVARLIENDHAYVAGDGAVYFSVESFPAYGQLSGNVLDAVRSGAGGRIEDSHQGAKRHPADFLLWKPDQSHLMKWDSPWGVGYPGWHIECSAMAAKVLGREQIDIHTGGEDNIFPHHECEIAQSCCASGKDHFARYWVHARHLMVEGEKMSKSKGNFFTIRDLMARGASAAAIRLELIGTHYRSNQNFTLRGLEDATKGIARLQNLWSQSSAGGVVPAKVGLDHPAVLAFAQKLADDLNIAGALAEVYSYVSSPDDEPAVVLGVLSAFDQVLGVIEPVDDASAEDKFAAEKCAALDAARQSKDFAAADAIRAELQDAGYEVKTGKQGSTARRKVQ